MATEIVTPSILTPENADQAVTLLRTYFGLDGSRAFAGAYFDTLGADETDPNDITPVDLVALATLSVPIKGYPAIDLLSPKFRSRARELLNEIPVDVSIESPDAMVHLAENGVSPAAQLWKLIADITGLGNVSTSKLLARKRPALIPVYDDVIDRQLKLGATTTAMWSKFHEWVNRDEEGFTLFMHAETLKSKAMLPNHVTPLRTIDVALWMDGREA